MGPRLDLPEGPLGFTRLSSPKPTIAAVSGWCLAGGFEVALWCDLRVATPSARFGFPERRFGVPLIDGGTQRLPRIVGSGRALDLVISGRVIDVEEADRFGLVTEIVAPGAHVERALAMAEAIAAFPQDTMLSDRRAVLEGAGLPLDAGPRARGPARPRPPRHGARGRAALRRRRGPRRVGRGDPGPRPQLGAAGGYREPHAQTGILIVLAAAAFGAVATPARAGTYTVFACGSYDNRSWDGVGAAGISADESCPGATTMGNAVGGGVRVALGATGSTTFTAPSGMTIADFTLTRQLTYRNGAPAGGTRQLYAIYKLGSTVFAGAGHYDNATRARLNAVGSWYGYPEKNIVVPTSTVSRASFPALAGYAGTATTLQIAVGCFNGSVDTACSVAASGGIAHLLSGAQVVLNDPTLPAASIEATGLLAGGRRAGSDAVTLDATDNGGIRRVEIIDLSGGGAVVGAEDYAAGARTDGGATCSARLRKPCPNLADETVRPTRLPAGQRTLKVRVLDAAGNFTDHGPYQVDVATPSDRGPFNGSGATEDGTLSARFSGGTKTRKTVSYRSRPTITGRLLELERTGDRRRPAAGADPRPPFRARASSRAPRPRPARAASTACGCAPPRRASSRWRGPRTSTTPARRRARYVTMNARASSSLRASARTIGVGQALRLSGTVRGTIPARGVPLIFQGRSGNGPYTTFADGRANARGRFAIRYRFRSGASRGRTFRFRVKLRGDARFPYALGYSTRVRVRVR